MSTLRLPVSILGWSGGGTWRSSRSCCFVDLYVPGHGLAPGTIPEEARKRIPKYPVVSPTLIGRLAVALEQQGKGLGALLLAKALRKAYESSAVVGSSMIVVDAIDEKALRFYQAHRFIKLPDSMRLILSMRMIASLLGE